MLTLLYSVICCHEQDNGILWKHTNTPTGRAAVVRQRLLILQTIVSSSTQTAHKANLTMAVDHGR